LPFFGLGFGNYYITINETVNYNEEENKLANNFEKYIYIY